MATKRKKIGIFKGTLKNIMDTAGYEHIVSSRPINVKVYVFSDKSLKIEVSNEKGNLATTIEAKEDSYFSIKKVKGSK